MFVAHRTQEDIGKAKSVDLNELRDPQTDNERVKKDEWLVTIGVCPHLGCVPLGSSVFGTAIASFNFYEGSSENR